MLWLFCDPSKSTFFCLGELEDAAIHCMLTTVRYIDDVIVVTKACTSRRLLLGAGTFETFDTATSLWGILLETRSSASPHRMVAAATTVARLATAAAASVLGFLLLIPPWQTFQLCSSWIFLEADLQSNPRERAVLAASAKHRAKRFRCSQSRLTLRLGGSARMWKAAQLTMSLLPWLDASAKTSAKCYMSKMLSSKEIQRWRNSGWYA